MVKLPDSSEQAGRLLTLGQAIACSCQQAKVERLVYGGEFVAASGPSSPTLVLNDRNLGVIAKIIGRDYGKASTAQGLRYSYCRRFTVDVPAFSGSISPANILNSKGLNHSTCSTDSSTDRVEGTS